MLDRRAALRRALGGREQLVTELRVCDCRKRLTALLDGLALQFGGAVLGDDHVDLVPRRRDHGAGAEPRHDPRLQSVVLLERRGQADQRAVRQLEPGAGHEVLGAADPAELVAGDRVGHDLAVDVDRERAVDRDHVAVGADHIRCVDDLDRQERDGVVAVQPRVELRRAERERRHAHTVVLAFAGVGDLAGAMQLHAAVGEHLAVQPVVAAVAFGQQRGDLVGNRADPRLQGRAGRDEVDGVSRDRLVDIGGRRIASGQRERCVGRAHEDVDLVDVQRMAMLRPSPNVRG